MFEGALVESGNKPPTKLRYWAIAALLFNSAVVAGLILFPLLHPDLLPRSAMTAMLITPLPPVPASSSPPHVEVQKSIKTTPAFDPMTAPKQIPTKIEIVKEDPPPQLGVAGTGMDANAHGGIAGLVMGGTGSGAAPVPVVVKVEPPKGPQRVSSGVMIGQLLSKTTPIYPPIARAAGVSGAVVLHATISKTGTIEELVVISGPEMLRAAAMEAVRSWRYKPYLLSGIPTEVETTVTVNFVRS